MKLHYALGIGVVSCPCLGVGAWQIYEEINPTLERALWKEGRSKNPISPGLLTAKEVSSTSATDYLSKEKYGCFQGFFPGANPPESTNSTTNSSGTQNLTNPFSNTDSSPVLGCALMKMVPTGSNNFFLKSEITFKNDTQGWAIWTHLTNYNSKDSNKVFIYFRILFLGRSDINASWSIKSGVYLKHYGSTVSGSPIVKAPNGTWNNYTQAKYYAGFWESSNDSNDNSKEGKKLMEEIKMEYGTNKLFEKGDIHTSTDTSNSLMCKGIYNTSDNNNKWTTFETNTNCCISGALTQAFQSFKDQKGAWTDAETFCSEVIKVRYKNTDDKTKERVRGLCYLLPQTSTTK